MDLTEAVNYLGPSHALWLVNNWPKGLYQRKHGAWTANDLQALHAYCVIERHGRDATTKEYAGYYANQR